MQTNRTVSPLKLAMLWFGIQLAWGAVLGLSLQARSLQLSGVQSLALFGAVSSAGALAAAFAQLVIGPLSDRMRRFGNKRIVFYAAGSGVAAIALIAFYLAPNVPTFVAAFVILQLAMNVAIGPYQAIIPDFVPTERIGVASGWMAAMQSGGNAMGAIAATLLGNTPTLGAAMALVLVLCATLTIRHLRAISLQPLVASKGLQVTRALVDLFISRALVYIGFYTLLGYFYFYVRNALPQPFAIDPTTASGVCVLLFTLVGAAGAALAAKPADRFDERAIVTVGGGVLAFGVGILAFAHSLIMIPIVISIAGVGWGIFLCADWAFACRLLPPGSLAATMAVWNLAIVGPQMLAPILATTLLRFTNTLEKASGPREAFMLASVELLLGALWIWRLPKRANWE